MEVLETAVKAYLWLWLIIICGAVAYVIGVVIWLIKNSLKKPDTQKRSTAPPPRRQSYPGDWEEEQRLKEHYRHKRR